MQHGEADALCLRAYQLMHVVRVKAYRLAKESLEARQLHSLASLWHQVLQSQYQDGQQKLNNQHSESTYRLQCGLHGSKGLPLEILSTG